MKFLDRFKTFGRRFKADRSGQVALTFAFAVIPMIGLAGLTMDYGNSLSVQAQLNAAADQAALEGVSTSGNPSMTLPTQASVSPYFYAAAANIPNVTINSVTVNATTSVNSLFVTVSYTATVTTQFSKVMGVSSFGVSGSASAQAQIPKYVSFYLLLDNSPSMGLAATTTDITNMQALTPDQCAFACHQHSFSPSPVAKVASITGGSSYKSGTYTNVALTGGSGSGAQATIVVTKGAVTSVTITAAGSGYNSGDSLSATAKSLGGSGSGFSVPIWTYITGDNTSDYYHLAKNNNITTRIDVLRTATQSLTSTAVASETLANQFAMGIYTFSDIFATIVAPTTHLVPTSSSDTTSVQTLANNIDLAYAYEDQRDTQTSYDTALHYMSSIIPTPGDGSTSAKPMEFLMLVTDGVIDEPVGSASGSGNTADYWSNGTSGWPTGSQANVSSTLSGNVSSTRLITTLNTATCTTIKNSGVKIAILYTTYLPVTVNAFYNSWVAPISSSIPTQLQSCASPGFFFQVSPSGGIAAAMQQMFLAALTEARLTK